MGKKPKIKIMYKKGKELQELSAIKLYSTLMQIKKDEPDGRLTPAAVVEASKPKNHVLHRFFTWNDSEAAAKYRNFQARGLINRTFIAVSKGSEKRKSRESHVIVVHKAIVSVRDPERETKNSYHPVVEVARRPDMSDIYLNSLKNKVRAIIKEFENYKELTEILNTLKTVL